MSYLAPNRPAGTAGSTYIVGSPQTSTYVPAGASAGGTYTTSSPRTSTYVTGGSTQQLTAAIGNYVTSSPRGSTYIPSRAATGQTYTTGQPYTTGTSSYPSTGVTRTLSGVANYVSSGNASNYVPSPQTSSYTPSSNTQHLTAAIGNYVTSSPRGSTYIPSGTTGANGTTRVLTGVANYVSSSPRSSTYVPSTTTTTLANQIGSYVTRTSGATTTTGASVTMSGKEYSLQKQVEALQKENEYLKKDKEKLQLVVHDLKRYAPEYKGDTPDDPDLDGSYMNLKQKNAIETMDMNIKQLKKKNKMLLEENDMLKTQVRTLCAADDSMNDKFLQTEVGKLQQKIRDLKAQNSEMEIQLKTYESDKRLGNKNKTDILNFDDGVREDHERLKRELASAYARINHIEKGESALGKANIDRYKALTNRLGELEMQNQNLLNKLKETGAGDAMRRSGMGDSEKDRELYKLRKENDELREELMQKNEVIRKLQSNKGTQDNPEAIQNLISANERLLAEVMKYQEKMNQSQSNMSIQKSHAFGESKKSPVLKSEFMDHYKDSRFTLD